MFTLKQLDPTKLDLTKLDLSKLDLTKIDLTDVKLPELRLPKFVMPKFERPDLPKVEIPFELPDLPKVDTDRVADFARDAAYVGLGAAVVAARAAGERRRTLSHQVATRVRKLVDAAA